MYQTLDDLEKIIQDYHTEESKSRKWIKWSLVLLGLIILFSIVLIVYNRKIKEKISLVGQSLGDKIDLGDGNVYSRLFQLEPEENSKDSTSETVDIMIANAEILPKLNDESFWNEKIEESIEKEFDSERNSKGNINIIGYGLLCNQYSESLKDCKYHISFSNEVNKGGRTSYEVYSNGSSTSSRNGFSYHIAAKEIAMDDIGNGGVFYDVSDSNYEDELKLKYLGENFESTYEGDYRFIEVVNLLTNNNDGTANYYLYIISDEMGKILYKNHEKLISRDAAKKIIAEKAGISTDDVKYLYIKINNLVYESKFSHNGHTYDFKIDAKDGKIIKGEDEIDIGDEKAMEIALKDSGLKAEDLRKDISHGHGMEQMLLMPEVNKEGTGLNAIYNVVIETEDDIVYSYIVRATDGKILSKHLQEIFIIYDKSGSKNDITYKIKSTHKKSRNIEIKPSELNMDDIYEFKDQIYLGITFDGNKIVDWSIIDRPYKHMGKMTRDELDEYYNFESHYPVKIVDKKINGEEENVYEIYLSKIDKNVIYKYTIMTGRNCSYKIINDIKKDVIVYEGTYGSEKYEATPYLKEGYAGRGGGGCTTLDGDVHFSIMYKEASSEDLFKIIDGKEITYLSKYKVGDEITLKQRYNENYLYNDTNNDLTISVTDYGIIDAPEDFQFTVKPGKFAHCYDATDIVKIIK